MTWGVWLLVAFFVILLIAFFPVWPYTAAWGYYPAAGVGLLFLLFLVLLFAGVLAAGTNTRDPRL